MNTTATTKPRQRQAIAPVRIVWLRPHAPSAMDAIQIDRTGYITGCPGWPELEGAMITNHADLKPGSKPVLLTCHGRMDLHRPVRHVESFRNLSRR